MEEAETIDKLRGIAPVQYTVTRKSKRHASIDYIQGLACKKAGSKKNVLLCRRSSFLQSVLDIGSAASLRVCSDLL